MRLKILLGILVYLLLYVSVATANTYDVTLLKIYDGDTVYLTTELWPDNDQFMKLRIYGMDTPEIRTRKACEKAMGYRVKQFLSNYLTGKVLTLSDVKYGKYAGRVIGNLYADGVLVSKMMIDKGYAVPYFGKKKTKVWC